MIIYFRTCEKQQTISNVQRFNNINKTDLLKKCWLSIQKSVSDSDKIIIIHDAVSQTTLDWLVSTSKYKQAVELIEVPAHDWSYHQHTVTLVEILNKYSNEYPDELHYIVEDDYLHTENAISVLKTNLAQWEGFAVTYDYPDRYFLDPVLSNVYLGADRHWRTINSSTMTVLAKGSTWLQVIDALKQIAATSNDQIFKQIYEHIPCISPLPGLASHMTDKHLTPLVDWNKVWEEQKIE